MPHAKYLDMLARLDAFTQSIKKGPACAHLVNQLADFRTFYSTSDRILVEKAVKAGDQREVLSAEELVQLQSYTQVASQKVGAIVTSLNSQKDCTEGRPASTLQAIAGVTMELSSLSSAYAGPYGVAIQVGGAAISGILYGIDAYIESQKDPYDFGRPEDRLLFITQLCSYDSIREEVITMVEMGGLINIYRTLLTELGIKRDKLIASHALAAHYSAVVELERGSNEALQSLQGRIRDVHAMASGSSAVSGASGDQQNPWARCMAISKMVYPAPMAIIDRVANVLQDSRVRDFDRSQVLPEELLVLARSPGGVPSLSACLAETDMAVLERKNRWSLSLLSELGQIYSHTFANAKAMLIQAGEKDIPGFGYNPVAELKETLSQCAWTAAELPKLEVLNSPNSYTVRRELSDRRMFLDNRLFSQLAPRFVDRYIDDSGDEYDRYREKSGGLLKSFYSRHLPKDRGPKTWKRFFATAKTIEEANLHSAIYRDLDIMTEDLLQSVTSYQIVQTYCTYISGRGTMSRDLEKACNSREFEEYRKKVNSLEEDMKELLAYFNWVYDKGYVDRMSLSALLVKIRKMHERIGVPISGATPAS